MHGQHWECRESGWLSYMAKLGTQRDALPPRCFVPVGIPVKSHSGETRVSPCLCLYGGWKVLGGGLMSV